ncbi:MAG: cob(I)yrinic acid a,c-diamide adenosyltransferase [Bacteroidales bacterium]|jgi:cob(I)alamin adenosyltransferase|nr:cob(I)yrinic acid a,c-diamide adenosyltransferase [Bacteroidales bacterium]
MKIYTKTGDCGKTSLVGGKRVEKYCERLECYGTVDELNAHIGVVHDMCETEDVRTILLRVQNDLFSIGGLLACENAAQFQLPCVDYTHIELLEQTIDRYNEALPQLKSFILPSGNVVASHCHVARTVCRRAERAVVKLAEHETIDTHIAIYLNRLSDFLFVLARKIMNDSGLQEITWKKP